MQLTVQGHWRKLGFPCSKTTRTFSSQMYVSLGEPMHSVGQATGKELMGANAVIWVRGLAEDEHSAQHSTRLGAAEGWYGCLVDPDGHLVAL